MVEVKREELTREEQDKTVYNLQTMVKGSPEYLEKRERLYFAFYPFYRKMANEAARLTFGPSGWNTDEFEAALFFGFCEALERFDASNGCGFFSYSVWWIRSYLGKERYTIQNRTYQDEKTGYLHKELSFESGFKVAKLDKIHSFDDVIPAPSTMDIERLEYQSIKQRVLKVLHGKLSPIGKKKKLEACAAMLDNMADGVKNGPMARENWPTYKIMRDVAAEVLNEQNGTNYKKTIKKQNEPKQTQTT